MNEYRYDSENGWETIVLYGHDGSRPIAAIKCIRSLVKMCTGEPMPLRDSKAVVDQLEDGTLTFDFVVKKNAGYFVRGYLREVGFTLAPCAAPRRDLTNWRSYRD